MKKKNTTKLPLVILHGECAIKQCGSIPSTAKPELLGEIGQTIIANSEVTGNHHVIDLAPGVEFFKDEKTNTRYMRNTTEATVRCVISERHSAVAIPVGDWVIGTQQEYDYVAEAMRNVQD